MFESFFTLGGVSYIMAFLALLVFGLFTGVVLILLNDTARRYFRKAGFPLLIVTVTAFIVVEIALLQVPPRSYEQGYQDGVGRPDLNCPVFRREGGGNLALGEDGALRIKHKYKLLGRPAVLTRSGEIHLWVANRSVFDDGTHLCSLALTANNAKFAEDATNAWDKVQGESESGGQAQQGGEQAEQNGGRGLESESGNIGHQDVVVELPSDQDENSDQEGDAQDAQDEGGEVSENAMAADQESHGSVTIRPDTAPLDKQ